MEDDVRNGMQLTTVAHFYEMGLGELNVFLLSRSAAVVIRLIRFACSRVPDGMFHVKHS